MALLGVRNVLGGTVPVMKGTAVAATVVGCPLYRNVSDGKLTAVATNGTKLIGFAAGKCDADGDSLSFHPCYPGIQFLLDYDGTAAATEVGCYAEITVTSGVPVVNMDESSNDILRLVEVQDSTDKHAWFEAANTANQWLIEVA